MGCTFVQGAYRSGVILDGRGAGVNVAETPNPKNQAPDNFQASPKSKVEGAQPAI
jgi:hypothetical protein